MVSIPAIPCSPHDERSVLRTEPPACHIVSNGDYTVLTTAAGSGFSRWRDISVSRWREDVSCDPWGSYVFVVNRENHELWSATFQPSRVEPDSYGTSFDGTSACFVRRDGDLETRTTIFTHASDPCEIRRIELSSLSGHASCVELTSYSELVLSPHGDDDAHPAFSKMFIQTEFDDATGALLAHRRLRKPEDKEVWAAHFVVLDDAQTALSFETDRARFIGSGRDLSSSLAMTLDQPLSGTTGTVLDPIFSLRATLPIPATGVATAAFWTVVGHSRADVLTLVKKYKPQTKPSSSTLSTLSGSPAALKDDEDAALFDAIASAIFYNNPRLRAQEADLLQGQGATPLLWAHAISGDIPILLLHVDHHDQLDTVRRLVALHKGFGARSLAVDLVLLNAAKSAPEGLQSELESFLTSQNLPKAEKNIRGGIFALRHDALTPETARFLLLFARIVLDAKDGPVDRSFQKPDVRSPTGEMRRRVPQSKARPATDHRLETSDLEFFNGLGGFDADGKDYVTIQKEGCKTPVPWMNVVTNEHFGFQVTASGSSMTWSVNSQQHHLTPWSNDPVTDRPGEVLYLRDDETGEIWTPTALPLREANGTYACRHAQGYSQFLHSSHEIDLELTQFVPLKDPIKISRLKIKNKSPRVRHLSITAYIEWELGPSRAITAAYLATEIDASTGALLARNLASPDFPGRVAFMDLAGRQTSWTGNRVEFLGANGIITAPAALHRQATLSKHVGAGFDPCGVLQTTFEIKPGADEEIVFFLGDTATLEEAQDLIKTYRSLDLDTVLKDVVGFWKSMLSTVTVKTPDRSMDIMLNAWLPYQVLACRVWSRAAFYQASGAYGFRDQLQDVMALAAIKPDETRAHLLRAASRQYLEGDVQHWWLPESGRGIRTRMTDDRLWLTYAVAHYIDVTGDRSVLDEPVGFLEGPVLKAEENEAFFEPKISTTQKSLYDHCVLAIDQSLGLGSHGLPLVGTGDWNDGMNRIGPKGKGESVWLAWFLYATLDAFTVLAQHRQDASHVATWHNAMVALTKAVEGNAWDGEWYRRAYFDDGQVLGSKTNDECQIDTIAQSWSVISGAADVKRATTAMRSVEERLIKKDDQIALLFTPAFDHTKLDPGYIKGYPPGLRENGGQYTHGAIWSILAFAMLGEGGKAHDLFSMLNPIQHSSTAQAVDRYKVEPYVICADVYAAPGHVGRGGWTWYTGSAGWMYRAGLEYILGFRLRGTTLVIDPCIPKSWPFFELVFRYHSSRYDIVVENPHKVHRGVLRVSVNGASKDVQTAGIELKDDGQVHNVVVTLGPSVAS